MAMANEILITYETQIEVFGQHLFEEWKAAYFGGSNAPWHSIPLHGIAVVLAFQFERDRDAVKEELRKEVQTRIDALRAKAEAE